MPPHEPEMIGRGVGYRWRLLRQPDAEVARAFDPEAKYHPVLSRILAARGWQPSQDLSDFLNPKLGAILNPFALHGMAEAVERLRTAIDRGERICVFGDYDADGICATAILVSALRWLGANPLTVIPNRVSDGYGMTIPLIEDVARQGATLIVTVDTGIGARAEIAAARALGVDTIVTDHHLASGELPEAVAILNPNTQSGGYGGGPLCGSGVAFKLAHALLKNARPGEAEPRRFLRTLMDLVALATVADVVPLVAENRIFVRHGLETLMNSERPGIRALLEVAGIRGGKVTPDNVAFALAPRLNAASRTDGDAMTALRLMLATTDGEAMALAQRLDAMNRERREVEQRMFRECVEEIQSERQGSPDAAFFVLVDERWHLGVVGTVAARVTERFHRPAVVMGIDGTMAKGSARSIAGYDVHEALGLCREVLVQFGGHAHAAGVRLNLNRVPELRERLAAHAQASIREEMKIPSLDIDTEVEAHELDWTLHESVQAMQPFGQGNRAPAFLTRGAIPIGAPKTFGVNHFKSTVRIGARTYRTVGFSKADRLGPMFAAQRPLELVFRPQENNFRGESHLELELLDARAAG